MERGPGSFIRNEEGELEENLKDPVMKKRKEKREKEAPPLNPPLDKEGTTVDKMTKDQLIHALVEKGVDPPDKANKTELQKLLEEVTGDAGE